MDYLQAINKLKEIQNALLEFLDDETEAIKKYEIFINLINLHKMTEERGKFRELLILINAISINHHRNSIFNEKVDKIIEYLRNDIKNFYSNSEIYTILQMNKRVLLYLIESGIITVDEYIASEITTDYHNKYNLERYAFYFMPEIKPFITEEFIEKYKEKNSILIDQSFLNELKKELPEKFYEKRRIGERDSYLSEIIRKDDVAEFTIYTNQKCLSLQSYVEESIFETNCLNKNITFIEYAAYYGSIGIIKNIRLKGVDFPKGIWGKAICSGNAELFQYLQENNVPPKENNFEEVLQMSLFCHHNDISKYIIENLINEEDFKNRNENNYYSNFYRCSFACHNYCFFPEDTKYKNILFYLSYFNYVWLVKLLIKESKIDVNAKSILNINTLNVV